MRASAVPDLGFARPQGPTPRVIEGRSVDVGGVQDVVFGPLPIEAWSLVGRPPVTIPAAPNGIWTIEALSTVGLQAATAILDAYDLCLGWRYFLFRDAADRPRWWRASVDDNDVLDQNIPLGLGVPCWTLEVGFSCADDLIAGDRFQTGTDPGAQTAIRNFFYRRPALEWALLVLTVGQLKEQSWAREEREAWEVAADGEDLWNPSLDPVEFMLAFGQRLGAFEQRRSKVPPSKTAALTDVLRDLLDSDARWREMSTHGARADSLRAALENPASDLLSEHQRRILHDEVGYPSAENLARHWATAHKD